MTGQGVTPAISAEHRLRPLWASNRIPLLLWLASRAAVTRAEAMREFPASRDGMAWGAFGYLQAAGWLEASGNGVRLAAEAVMGLATELDATLPRGWATEDLDVAMLHRETNLWRAPNRLRALRAVQAGGDTRAAIAAISGLSSAAVSRALLELVARGDVIDVGRGVHVYQPRAYNLRRLVVDLQAGLAARKAVEA